MPMTAMPTDKIFKPAKSKHETKSDATTKAAWDIIDTEASRRAAKTERLRAARLAQEEAAPPAPPVKKKAQRAAKAG
jgi:hypothetical protein